MTTVMYGIANCDTIKKAKKWLDNASVEYRFHDYRKDGIAKDWLTEVEAVVGWEQLLNKRGTTYRQLSDEQKADLTAEKAITLLVEYPAMIKRPLLQHNDNFTLGFKPATYEEIFTNE